MYSKGDEESPRWILLEPVGGIGQRLAAIASARLLAQDLERQLVLDWRLTPECNCPWERLVGEVFNLRLLRGSGRAPLGERPLAGRCWGGAALQDAGEEEEAPALRAGVELLRLWGLVRRSTRHEDLLRLGLEFLNKRHMAVFRKGQAHLLDVGGARWRHLRRMQKPQTMSSLAGAAALVNAKGLLEADCLCIRSSDTFYPPNPAEMEWSATAKELSNQLRRLDFSDAVRRQMREVIPGTVGLLVPQHLCNRAVHAFSPVQMLELEVDSFPHRSVFLATDDPMVKEHFKQRYGGRLDACERRTLDRLDPEFVEDTLADFLTLARADRIFGTLGGVDLRVASIISGRNMSVDTVFYEQEDPCQAEVTLADPVEPRGPFFLVGSWNDWKDFAQLMPSTTVDFAYSTSIVVRKAPGYEEFQIVINRDWGQRFYPSSTGAEILGPSSAHGSNWRVKIPPGCVSLRVLWDPRGARSFSWRFVGRSGWEWGESQGDDKRLLRSSHYALAGTWDNWKEFADLIPTSLTEPTYCRKIRVGKGETKVEFQIIQDRDWNLCFYPASENLGAEIQGPDHKHGSNWQVTLPEGCRWLYLTWDPRGDRSVDWNFLDRDQGIMASPVNRSGPFFLLGSWDNWAGMTEMLPVAGSGPVCAATVKVRPEDNWRGFEEFAILQEQDWNQCIYPSFLNMRRALGPDDKNKKGQLWRVRLRPQYRYLRVTFAPPTRSVEWRFMDEEGAAVVAERTRRSAPDWIGDWRVQYELGRGWAGGVVYMAQYITETRTAGGFLCHRLFGELDARALICTCKAWMLLVGFWRATGAEPDEPQRSQMPSQSVEQSGASPSPELLGGGGVEGTHDWSLLLRAPCHDHLFEQSDLVQLVAVDVALCDAILGTSLDGEVTRCEILSAVSCKFLAGPDDAEQQKHEGTDACDVAERHWQMLTIIHHSCHCCLSRGLKAVRQGSLATFSACSRGAAVAAACGEGRLAEAALACRPPRLPPRPGRALPPPQPWARAAVKSPVPLHEIRMLRRLQGVKGLPSIMDMGMTVDNHYFCAMQLLGPSLDQLLTRCDHDGLGGRVSWPVARGLGTQMVRIIRDIHRRGIVHCDIKPGNVMVGLHDTSVYIIDFGLSACAGAARFKQVGGTLPYNSIAAGYPGLRTPADDLESVGWLLLKCVLGQLPWQNRNPNISRDEPAQWQKRSEGMSLMKEWFLEDPSILGDDSDYCPEELRQYFRECRRLGKEGLVDSSYLARWNDDSLRWSRFVATMDASARGLKDIPRTVYMAARGALVGRLAPDAAKSQTVDVPAGLKIRTTGASQVFEGYTWLEWDPVWMPRSALPFAEGSWLQQADHEGPLLVATDYQANAVRKLRT